jgi:TonB family protein
MNTNRSKIDSRCLQRAGMSLFQAAALALVVAMAMPAWAANSRAIKSRVPPVYPEIAKRMKIDGAVVIEVTVNADGGVSNVKALSGNRMLSNAAEDAVRKWKFEPGDGQATIQVTINFSLSQ